MKILKEVEIDGIVHAEWNPRSTDELKQDHPEMIKLVSSVRKNGVLEPIGVWMAGADRICIYGNRRLEAARIAGLKTVHAVVYEGIDDATARVLTREENENRFGVDPFRDAELVNQAVSMGLTQKAAAEAFGLDEVKVCRIMRLNRINSEIVEMVRGKDVDMNALYEISTWPEDVQKRSVKRLGDLLKCNRDKIHTSDVKPIYGAITCAVDPKDWQFTCAGGNDRLARCRSCALCTGNQPDLFDSADTVEERCTNPTCFKEMLEKAKLAIIRERVGDDQPYSLISSSWQEPYHSICSSRKSKKNTHAWVVWRDWDHCVDGVKFGPSPDEWAEIERKQREKSDEEDRIRRASDEKSRALHESAVRIVKEMLVEKEGDPFDGPNIVDRVNAILSTACVCPQALFKTLFFDFGLTQDDVNICGTISDEDVSSSIEELFGQDHEKSVRAACDLFVDKIAECLNGEKKWVDGRYVCDDPKVRLFFVDNDSSIRMALNEKEVAQLTKESLEEDED